jgi:hypothetical protein
MSDCCVKSVPQSDSSYETFDQPVMDWMARLTAGLNRSIPSTNQTMGEDWSESFWKKPPKKKPIRVRRFVRFVAISLADSVLITNGRIKPALGR